MNVRTGGWMAIALVLAAAPCYGQVGGGPSNLRRFGGGSEFVRDSFGRPAAVGSSRSTTLNAGTRQSRASTTPLAEPPVKREATLTSGTSNALSYYGAPGSRETLSRLPMRPRFVPQGGAPVGVASGKPYNNVTQSPTISPYLGLFRTDLDDTLPNYYAYVRPYQNQVQRNSAQQKRIQSLQSQVRQASHQVPQGANGAMPPTGFKARFGDTGQFYGGWRR